jgi:hypothetical protein
MTEKSPSQSNLLTSTPSKANSAAVPGRHGDSFIVFVLIVQALLDAVFYSNFE